MIKQYRFKQFSLAKFFLPIDSILSGGTTPGQSGPKSNDDEEFGFVWFGLVLWHISYRCLFNAKSSFYIYIYNDS